MVLDFHSFRHSFHHELRAEALRRLWKRPPAFLSLYALIHHLHWPQAPELLMIIFRILSMLLFFAAAISYLSDVAAGLEAGSVNHMQVGVLVVSVYCFVSTMGHDARDNHLKKIFKALERNEE